MKIVEFGDNLTEKITVCLGHFDGIHLAHRKIIEIAKSQASKTNSKLAVFTFDDDFSLAIKGSGSIFTFEERVVVLESLGVDYIVKLKSSKDFLSLQKDEFLSKLVGGYSVVWAVCGSDYSYGYKGQGNVEYLYDFLALHGIGLTVVDDVYSGSEKISASLIKKYMSEGRIEDVTRLLGYEYFCIGRVVHGENVGEKIGFPTINTLFPSTKHYLKKGVYKTQIIIDGKKYNSITNFGYAPTFDRNNFVIETHVLNFNEKVYGKEVRLIFVSFMREMKKFSSVEELTKQLKEDKSVYD